MKNTVLFCGLFLLTLVSFGQKNPFLDRAFWRSNPSIEDIDQQIKEGHDIAALTGSAFDAVSWALIEKTNIFTFQRNLRRSFSLPAEQELLHS